ncbi:MAG: hypothetical protein NUW02_00945 [Candidatus Campbellbacteria bacterium]|nr:hypothetical protein [Candidatus Campbellbacteria bacterium]
MNWMNMLYWVIGIIGYILMGGLVVRTARNRGYDKPEFWWGMPRFLIILLVPSPLMGLLWPLSVLTHIVLDGIEFVFKSLNGFK